MIIGIDHDVDGPDARVTVGLEWNEAKFYGQSLGAADGNHRARLAGEATLRAVEHLCGDEVSLELMAVATQQLGPVSIALAQVQLDGTEMMVGNAIIEEDDADVAAVRAVMDAVNRRLGLMLED